MRFVICGIGHETNTFSPFPAGREAFEKFELFIGEEIVSKFRNSRNVVGGFIKYCDLIGAEIIPTLTGFAQPSGPVTTAALEEFLSIISSKITETGPVDAILARQVGSMVTEDHDDGDGYILQRLRQAVGPNVPIVSTLDPHSNISKAMVEYADILVGYDTYPHVDWFERGYEAAELAHRMVKKEIIPTVALEKLPFWPPGPTQVTLHPPMKDVMEKAFDFEKRDKVLNVTVSMGFAWADVPHMGFSVVVTTDRDQSLADRFAKELAEFVWNRRSSFQYKPVPVDEAVKRAIQAPEGPIVLADIADNPGGGTPGDGTVPLQSLLAHKAENVALGLIRDPDAVSAAVESGVGTEVTLKVGGKTDDLHGPTLTLTGYVKHISDGIVHFTGPMATGIPGYYGRTVVFHCQGIDILLSENRLQPFDREVFRYNGITPENKKILVLKSLGHYRADFEPIAKEIIEVGAPGILSPDLSLFDYKKIPRPFFPLDHL